MNSKVKDYIVYGVLAIIFIFSLYLIFSPVKNESKPSTNTLEELVLDTPVITVKVGEESPISAHVNNNSSAMINYLSTNNDIATVTINNTVKGIEFKKPLFEFSELISWLLIVIIMEEIK